MIVATADSNIYISALQFGGPPREFLNRARAGGFRLAISQALIDEIRGVLLEKFAWTTEMLDEAIAQLGDFSQIVQPSQTVSVVREDPDDDRVLECALASNSQYIISGDKHLLRLGHYEGINIIRVADFLELIPKPSF